MRDQTFNDGKRELKIKRSSGILHSVRVEIGTDMIII